MTASSHNPGYFAESIMGHLLTNRSVYARIDLQFHEGPCDERHDSGPRYRRALGGNHAQPARPAEQFQRRDARALYAARSKAARDNGARAILLTGAGRGFCAGQDLGDRDPSKMDGPPDLGHTVRTFYAPLVRLIRSLEFPVVCAVNGVAAGAGANLALACDHGAGRRKREIHPVLRQGRAGPRHRGQLAPAPPSGRGARQGAGADRRAAERGSRPPIGG